MEHECVPRARARGRDCGRRGRLARGRALRKLAHRLPVGLLLVGSLAIAALAYGIAGVLGGSGFLAVYLVGLGLGDAPLAEREPVVAFHRGLAMAAEIGMFFALGLLVYPSQFGPIAVEAVLLALVTALVARPLAATLATVRHGFTRGERVLLAWGGLRGAVPVIMATFAVIEHAPRGVELLSVVFITVLLSAALQGLVVQILVARAGRNGDGLSDSQATAGVIDPPSETLD